MMPDPALFADRCELTARPRSTRMHRLLPFLVGLVLPAGLVFLAPGCGGAKQEARRRGDLPYAVLDKAFQPLRRDFEDGDGRVRLVGIVSPTCGECIDNVAAIDERLLPAIPGEGLEVFLVWACTIPADVEVGTRKLAERYADPRIRHYWDGSGRIARAFGRHAGLPDGAPAYGLFYLYGRADTWDPEGRMSSEPAGYNAILDDWQPADPRMRAGKHPRLKLPQFRVETLRSEIERLLAEPDAAAGAGRR